MLTNYYRNGSATAIVMFVAFIVGSLALTYFRYAGELTGTRTRFVYKEYVKEITESAINEIFNKTINDSKNTNSEIFNLLKSSVGKSVSVVPDFTKFCSEKYLPEDLFVEIFGKIKVIDFGKYAPNGNLYKGKSEGHGIVAVEAKTLLYKSKGFKREFISSYYIEEHHDYIISSAVCMGEHGSKLSNSLVVRQNRELGELDSIKSNYDSTLNRRFSACIARKIIFL